MTSIYGYAPFTWDWRPLRGHLATIWWIPQKVGEWLMEVSGTHVCEIGCREICGAAPKNLLVLCALVASRLQASNLEHPNLSANTGKILARQR